MIDTHVLVLNRFFQPVNVTNVRRALCLMYIDTARALDRDYRLLDFVSWAALSAEWGQDVVNTVSHRIRIPRIVVLQTYERIPRGRVRFSRHNIFVRDDHTCQYCHRRLPRRHLNLDHVVPRSQGGGSNWENVVASCIPCNIKKGGRTPAQAGMTLRQKPARPTWDEMIRVPRLRARYREWLPFLSPVDALYWNTELESD